MAQIYFDAVGKNGAIVLMSLLFSVQWLMGVSILVAAYNEEETLALCLEAVRAVELPAGLERERSRRDRERPMRDSSIALASYCS